MLLLNQSSSVTLTGLLETFSGSASGKACCRAAMGALHKERSRPRRGSAVACVVVDACLGGWSGEIAGGQAPFGAWRGDACRRLRTCGPCRESRCSARPASAPRLRAQHGRRHSVVSLSLRLPGSVLLSCALVLLCAGPRRPHAMRRGDPGSGSREPPAFSFLPARPVALGFGTTRDGRHGVTDHDGPGAFVRPQVRRAARHVWRAPLKS
jgi:hypothetical protein